MAECKHCKGTGIVPDKLTLECIGCQIKVVVTYDENTDLAALCENVRCAECKQVEASHG